MSRPLLRRILRGLAVQLLCLCPLVVSPMLARASEEDKAEARKGKAEAQKTAHDTKRAVNKADHRIDEADCSASAAECARRKRTNRVQEAKELTSDEIHEAADLASDARK